MALIKCPECQKEVSESAFMCPHCGVRVRWKLVADNVKMRASNTKTQINKAIKSVDREDIGYFIFFVWCALFILAMIIAYSHKP